MLNLKVTVEDTDTNQVKQMPDFTIVKHDDPRVVIEAFAKAIYSTVVGLMNEVRKEN